LSRRHHRHVVSEKLLADILTRERKRADRSNEPYGVLILAAPRHPNGGGCVLWREIIEALTASTREGDIVGWIERDSTIGVILHELHAQDPAYPREFEARVRHELALRLDPNAVARLSIGLQFFAP